MPLFRTSDCHRHLPSHRTAAALRRTTTLTLIALALPLAAAHAQGSSAHVHGHVELGVAVEGPAIVIEMRTPLDNLIGFERAPRTDVEKNTVAQTLARLKAADHLFRIDPTGSCKLGPVTLEAPVLGLSDPQGAQPDQGTKQAASQAAAAPKGEHAEMLASFAFNCTAADQVKFIEVDLFNAFTGVRQIDAEIATAEGQFKRTLKKPANRLSWTP